MINLDTAHTEFKKYVTNFDTKDSNIDRKIFHTYRVEEISGNLAKQLNLDIEKIQLAMLIALLHDIGRFEQYKRFKIYSDSKTGIDHGDLGIEILTKDNYIRKYIKDNKYDNLIKKSILNHNKYELEKNLNEQEELFCKIIKDSDKIDIIYEATEIFWKDRDEEIGKQNISKDVLEMFSNQNLVEKSKKKNELDSVVGIVSFIYDMNFKESFNIIKEKNYINKIIDRFEIQDKKTKEEIENIRKIANKYIEEKINKG